MVNNLTKLRNKHYIQSNAQKLQKPIKYNKSKLKRKSINQPLYIYVVYMPDIKVVKYIRFRFQSRTKKLHRFIFVQNLALSQKGLICQKTKQHRNIFLNHSQEKRYIQWSYLTMVKQILSR